MKKEQEIEILQSLKGDTYFAQLFGDAEIDAMCENIRNDFPIECGIALFQGSQVAKENATLKGKLAARWEAEEAAVKVILRKADEHLDDVLEEAAERLVGRKKCLRLKLSEGMDLSEDDREELMRYLDM